MYCTEQDSLAVHIYWGRCIWQGLSCVQRARRGIKSLDQCGTHEANIFLFIRVSLSLTRISFYPFSTHFLFVARLEKYERGEREERERERRERERDVGHGVTSPLSFICVWDHGEWVSSLPWAPNPVWVGMPTNEVGSRPTRTYTWSGTVRKSWPNFSLFPATEKQTFPWVNEELLLSGNFSNWPHGWRGIFSWCEQILIEPSLKLAFNCRHHRRCQSPVGTAQLGRGHIFFSL